MIWRHKVLDSFQIEIPSWGFANTGTRFGKFMQAAAASTIEEKFADAAEVNRLTGATPTLALHVLWDLPNGVEDVPAVKQLEPTSASVPAPSIPISSRTRSTNSDRSAIPPRRFAARPSIMFLIQSRSPRRSARAISQCGWPTAPTIPAPRACASASAGLKKPCAPPMTASPPTSACSSNTSPSSPPSITPILPTGAWPLTSRASPGPQSRVLVDTGHHYSSQNIEQIVAWLLHTGLLGGFHFNDRRYADDDLTLGSIDPYQIFRIFHELHCAQSEALPHEVAYMVDQSHNLKGKIEAMVQTVVTAQELYLKAALVDREQLAVYQQSCDLVAAEELFRGAFWRDVRPMAAAWRESRGLPADPLAALRSGGYVERIATGARQPSINRTTVTHEIKFS